MTELQNIWLLIRNDLPGLGLYIGFLIATGLPSILIKLFFKIPSEVVRKMYHMAIVLSIFPLVLFFHSWITAVLAALLLMVVVYPLLVFAERFSQYSSIAVERSSGEFKSSLLIVQLMMSFMLFFFWGLLGSEWKYVAVAAVMAWGFGDAAAALVGKKFGRRPIRHPLIEGKKTLEGAQAMLVMAALAIFFTFLIYGGQPWPLSLAVALLVAPVSAAVELFSRHGMDTLTVPVSTGMAVLTLLSLFSFFGA